MEPGYLAARFRQVAERHAARIAVIMPTATLTYGELFSAAEDFARNLIASGAKSAVAITVSRNRASLVAMLGAILAGLPYSPVDAAYPDARVAFMLDDLAARVHVDATAAEPVIRVIGTRVRERVVHSDTLYILYTSGSSGQPKGCMVTHRNVLSLFDSTASLFTPSPDDVSSVLHSLAFDFSVWELWSAWLYGGTCWLPEADVARDPQRLTAGLAEHRVSRLSLTPSLFAYLSPEIARSRQALPRLRSLVLGGEAVRLSDVAGFLAAGFAPGVRVVNMYGITETTVHVTYRELTGAEQADPSGSTPIGHPIPSLRVSLRDENGIPVRTGKAGEIWVSGAGVTAGYLNRQELTAERFITEADGTMWYRSGDLARHDGREFCYIGRSDRQVQLRGFRIELGEIEAALESCDGITAAVAAVEKRAGTGLPVLVSYAQAAGASGNARPASLRRQLRGLLPPQAVPQAIHLVSAFPLTANGKIDMAELRSAVRSDG